MNDLIEAYDEITRLKKELRAMQTYIASIGKGYWTKKPCDAHYDHFALECPACNAKNDEFVLIDEKAMGLQ